MVMWNFLGVIAWITMRKKQKIAKWFPVFIIATTVITFLMGYFGSD